MDCAQCGGTLAENAKFCSNCGTRVNAAPGAARKKRRKADAPATRTQAVRDYGMDVAKEAGALSKTALKSDLGKKMAAGAAIGAVVAVPVPFVGPAVGAVIGAGIVAFRRLTKD